MGKRILYLGVLICGMHFLSACVEKAKPTNRQVINLYTDFPESLKPSFFREFERVNKIQVLIHHKSSEKIIQQINDKKYDSGVDMVLFMNAIDLIRLDQLRATAAPLGETEKYQALLHDPYVFRFPKDTLPLFSSFGQLFRNDYVKINCAALRETKEWENLMGGLIQKYPKILPSVLYRKIMHSDSLKGKGIKELEILPYSSVVDKETITYPDQYYYGSVGKISGMALIRHAKHRTNALLLYAYCKQEWWRKKLAKRLKVFPILSEEANKSREILLYQKVLEKEPEIIL